MNIIFNGVKGFIGKTDKSSDWGKHYINIVKGLAIFLMLWGHCIQYCIPSDIDFFENPVFKAIYSFHMPLFMLISGYLFYFSSIKRELKELLIHRCKGLMQTIIMGGIFVYYATTGVYAVIQGDCAALVNGKWLYSLSEIWFIWSILGASIVLGFICKKVNKWYMQVLLLCLGGIFVCLLPNWQNNLYMYPYYVVGYYFAKYHNFILRKIGLLKYASLIVFPLLLLFYGKEHYIYTTGIFNDSLTLHQCVAINIFRWLIGFAGSCFVLISVWVIYNFTIRKKEKLTFVLMSMDWLGTKSLQIYVLSIIFLSSYFPVCYSKVVSFFPYIEDFWKNHMFVYNYIFTFILAIIYAIGLSFVVKMLEKFKISKIIFGR